MRDTLALIEALNQAARMVREGYWIKIEYPHPSGSVVLDYGAILSNGERERSIGTMTFITTARGVIASDYVHP